MKKKDIYSSVLTIGKEDYKGEADNLFDALNNIHADFKEKNPNGKINTRGLLTAHLNDLKAELTLQPVFIRRFMFSNQMRQILAKRLNTLFRK